MKIETDALLSEAKQLIEQQNLTGAAAVLDVLCETEALNLEAHNLREKYKLKGNFGEWMGVNAEISPDDDIFRFFANHPTSKNPVRDYLSDGWRTMVELQDVLDLYGLSLRQCGSFLEFACGQGRFTRHLARIFKQDQLTVSDVVPGSVDFLQNAMGVKGFYSSTDPDQVKISGQYDVVFVLSLFSHLPPLVWRKWLQVLYGSLKPNGILIFSTHGEKCARLAGVNWDETECSFYPSSESTVLDGQTYGCTYASIDYVQHAVKEALGTHVNIKTIQNHFWGNQDCIAVSK